MKNTDTRGMVFLRTISRCHAAGGRTDVGPRSPSGRAAEPCRTSPGSSGIVGALRRLAGAYVFLLAGGYGITAPGGPSIHRECRAATVGTQVLTSILAPAALPKPTVRWIGQDGHDLTGFLEPGPSDYQDIHLHVRGLPTSRPIAKVLIAAAGGGSWSSYGLGGTALMKVEQAPGAPTADLYIEPYCVENGRKFFVRFYFDNDEQVEVEIKSGKADPNLRTPQATMIAKWIGQDRRDATGVGPSVGPDGIQDVRIALTRLAAKLPIHSIIIEGPGGLRWEYGLNPKGYSSAELIRDPKDASKADLYIQPKRDLAGQPLRIRLTYKERGDSTTVVAGRCDPKLAMPRVTQPGLAAHGITGRWLGQDASPGLNAGDVHVALSGLPAARPIVGAILTDTVRGTWVYRSNDRAKIDPIPFESPLALRRGKDRDKADLSFAPYRDETGEPLTLRLVFLDGESAFVKLAGGACNPDLRVPAPEPTSTTAKPGDDLNDLANRFGTVRLGEGTYQLTKPLVLGRPVTLIGEGKARLVFSQGANDPAWTTAIKIHAGGTTLRGFSVRFAGPIRWRTDFSFGPAVIGTTDSLDHGAYTRKRGLTFTQLDIEGPPSSKPGGWEETPKLMRLLDSENGRITNNVVRGGFIEFFDGPWTIADNEFRATPPGTFSPGTVGGHWVHDVVVRGNRVKPVGPSGKMWRFGVFTNRATGLRIENNVIEGIGHREDDTIPWDNAPEIILTECYRLHFEGKLAALSPDGRVVRIPTPQGEPAGRGDIVSILAGPNAGQWRKIAQPLGPTTYVLDSPLPRGTEVISIATGFTGVVIEGNTIDTRAGKKSVNLVLAGNHYGTVVRNNRFLGGEAFRIESCASEAPGMWGWSHVPYLGGLIEGNVIEDAVKEGQVVVQHGQYTKTNLGRTYMTMALRNNIVRWTAPYLRGLGNPAAKASPKGIVVGETGGTDPGVIDPGELVVTEEGDRLQAPPGTDPGGSFHVTAAFLNGRRTVNRGYVLPLAPLAQGGPQPDSRSK